MEIPLLLSVRGDLDTANPITDRPLGALVRAKDLHPRYWGPRVGSQAFTRIWEAPGTASLYDEITFVAGVDAYGTGSSHEDGFRDLGTQFTLDLWFRLTDTTFAAGKDKIGLYKFVVNAAGVVEVAIAGPTHASPGVILVYIVTTPTRTTTDTVVTLVGATAITTGTAQVNRHHVRLVRDGANLDLFLNGVLDKNSTALVSTSGVMGPVNSQALVGLGNLYIGTDLTVTTKGVVYGAVLRDGAFSGAPVEAVMPCAPWARNVHHYYLGRNFALGGNDHFFDAGRFGAHARIKGVNPNDYTVTASNDNSPPAPARIQGMRTWATRGGRTASVVVAGGVLSHAIGLPWAVPTPAVAT